MAVCVYTSSLVPPTIVSIFNNMSCSYLWSLGKPSISNPHDGCLCQRVVPCPHDDCFDLQQYVALIYGRLASCQSAIPTMVACQHVVPCLHDDCLPSRCNITECTSVS